MQPSYKNILIVEDNPYIGSKILKAIKNIDDSIKPVLSASVMDAKALINKNNVDILILDLSLPDGSGLEILKMLKEKKANTKVYVFSASTYFKNICLKQGAVAFFDKANDFNTLIETIKNLN